MKLSLCIATFNSEREIHYPLDSAYDFVDEVVIVDGGSGDRTVERVKSYGKKVKVIKTDNPPMFHKNKQKAIKAALGEWILQLDADEALTPELKLEISAIVGDSSFARSHSRSSETVGLNDVAPHPSSAMGFESLAKSKSPPVAYWLPRKNLFLGKFLTKGGVYPDYTIRLYKNGVAHFPCKSVHENVEIVPPISILSERTESKDLVGYLKNPILHYSYPTFADYLRKWRNYNNLEADLLRKNFQFPSAGWRISFQFLRLSLEYLLIKPIATFINMYVLRKGFVDGGAGFVFAFFSSIRFPAIFLKWLQKMPK